MIRKIIVFTYFIVSGLVSRSQVNMTLQVPPAGVLLKSQLWNILVVSANSDQQITVNLSLQDAQTNQEVLNATSRLLIIAKGASQLQAADFSPIQYEYYTSAFNNDQDPNGMLPAGNYLACYSIITSNKTTLTENCIPVNVEPLSPPLLNTPANEAVLQTSYPQFTWLPPTPKSIFGDLNYDFILVEVLPGQSGTEAIQNNIPVYSAGHIKDQFYNYPASYEQLDTARLYAWRVIAKSSNNAGSPSDIWTFKIKSEKPDTIPDLNSNYILLKRSGEIAGTYTIENKSINIKYYSFDREHVAEVQFLSSDGRIIKTIKQNIAYGDNFLSYRLEKSFQQQQIYFIQIKDIRNNKYTASFRIK